MGKKADNTTAGEMTYEVVRLPNARIERDRAIREGAEAVTLPEAESQTIEITTDNPKKRGR